MQFRLLCLALVAALLSSCGLTSSLSKSPRVLSSQAARDIAMRGGAATPGASWFQSGPTLTLHAPAKPSSAVQAHASRPNRDRHGMPVYGSTGERVRLVRTTAYTCSESDHLPYGSMNAAGTVLRFSNRLRSAAADWSVYPIGTVFKVKGQPYLYVVDDYGSALTGTQTVDLYMPNHVYMQAWGKRNVELSVVRWGSFERSAELLSKRMGYSHCRQMHAAISRRGRDSASAAL
jgi:3D (Asp-Asp-Asp) domain-containing protein